MASFNLTTEKEDVFHERVNYDYTFLLANVTRLGIPDPESVLKAPVEDFDAALTKAQNTDRTKSDILRKNQTQKTLKDKIGAFGEEYIFHNHNLTAADIVAFGLHQCHIQCLKGALGPRRIPCMIADWFPRPHIRIQAQIQKPLIGTDVCDASSPGPIRAVRVFHRIVKHRQTVP